jgi:hypothetical protein
MVRGLPLVFVVLVVATWLPAGTAAATCRPMVVVKDLTGSQPLGTVAAAERQRGAGETSEARGVRITVDGKVVPRPDAIVELDRGLGRIVSHSDRAVAGGPAAPAEARCAVELIAGWASGEGMLGVVDSRANAFRVAWRSAGVAMAWVKVRAAATPEEAALVCGWMRRLVPVARSTVTRSNAIGEVYLAGLVALAVGVGCGDDALVVAGRAAFDAAAAAIDERGALPALVRGNDGGWRSHAFAMTVLAPMAELAARELRQDWWSTRDGALHRLAGLTILGARDPAGFRAAVAEPPAAAAAPAGAPAAPGRGSIERDRDLDAAAAPIAVEPAATVRRGLPPGMAWLALYARRFPDRAVDLPEYRAYSTWTGGDLAGLATAWIAP